MSEASRLIEGIESQFGRFETSENTMDALLGAIALALCGKDYNDFGKDLAAGIVAKDQINHGEERKESQALVVSAMMAGISPDFFVERK